MKRILVLGSGGAGKSTFSRRLGEILGIEVIHLDAHYWHAGWVKTEKEEWEKVVAGLLERGSWIMDGNYGGTREMRLRACDTVIFLDISRYVCLHRIFKRAFTYRNRSRPDTAEGCPEKVDLELFLWVWNYPKRAKRRILAQLSDLENQKKIIRLRSSREIDDFLKNCNKFSVIK